jgi:hypothetical protein
MPKLTPKELLRSLDEVHDDGSGDEGADEDMEAILAMTPEQVRKKLEAAGYTEAELVAKEDALLGRPSTTTTADATGPMPTIAPATVTAKSAEVISLAARRRVSRWVILLPIAAAFALLALEGPAMIAWWKDEPAPNERVTHPNDEPDARTMRHDAAKAMEAKEWRKALDLLDRAKKVDPPGDEAPAVQDARKVARAELLVLGGLEGGGGR